MFSVLRGFVSIIFKICFIIFFFLPANWTIQNIRFKLEQNSPYLLLANPACVAYGNKLTQYFSRA